MDRLEEYAGRMELKKRVRGGLDEEDVRRHIGELCRLAREEKRKLEEELEEAREELEETRGELEEVRGKLKHYRTAYRDRQQENGWPDPDGEETRKTRDEKYHEMVMAAEALHKARKEAEGAVRKEMKEEMERETEKFRNRLQEEIRKKRQEAEEELSRLREETRKSRQEAEKELSRLREEAEDLEYRKRSLEESFRRDQEQWRQHIGWMVRRLGLREEGYPEQAGSPAGTESGKADPGRTGHHPGTGQVPEGSSGRLAYMADTDWNTDDTE